MMAVKDLEGDLLRKIVQEARELPQPVVRVGLRGFQLQQAAELLRRENGVDALCCSLLQHGLEVLHVSLVRFWLQPSAQHVLKHKGPHVVKFWLRVAAARGGGTPTPCVS